MSNVKLKVLPVCTAGFSRHFFGKQRWHDLPHFFKFTPLWIMSDNGYSDTDFRKYDAGNLYLILALPQVVFKAAFHQN